MTVHLISVHLSSLTIFLFFFFTRCFVLLPFIFLYTSLRLTGEERAKATSRKEIEDYAAEPKTMKISSFQLRWSSWGFTGLWCVIFGYLFIWDYEANSFYILLTHSIFLKHFSGKYNFFCFAFSLSFLLVICVWLIWI